MTSQSDKSTAIKYIAFQFAKHSDNSFPEVHSALNNTFADELEDVVDTLFIDSTDAGSELVGDVEALLKRVITDSIVEEADDTADYATILSSIKGSSLFAILNSNNQRKKIKTNDHFKRVLEDVAVAQKNSVTIFVSIDHLYFDVDTFRPKSFNVSFHPIPYKPKHGSANNSVEFDISTHSLQNSMVSIASIMNGNARKKAPASDQNLPVRNFILVKRLEDVPGIEGGIRMVITIVQYVFNTAGVERFQKARQGEPKYFDYRFNDFQPNETELKFRRTEEPEFVYFGGSDHFGSEQKCSLWRSTFNGKVPVELQTLHDLFPFKIVKATLDIELSSDYVDKGVYRPTLVLPKERFKNGQRMRGKPLILRLQQRPFDGKKMVDIDDTMDQIEGYELLSPYPRVCFRFDKKKNYCSSYSVSFYLKNKGVDRLVSTILPLFLVSIMNTLAVLNDMREEHFEEHTPLEEQFEEGAMWITETEYELARKHLEMTSILSLTVVFLLRSIHQPERKSSFFSRNNLYLLFIFMSLVLSSFLSKKVRFAGAMLMWVSFCFPLFHYFAYEYFGRKYKRCEEDSELFLSGKNYENWSSSKHSFSDFFIKLECDEFMSFEDLQRELRENGYTVDETDKGCNIYYGLGK